MGAKSMIVCGNIIGRNAFGGAGAVVTYDVQDYTVVQGVPATQTGWICGQLLGNSKFCTKCNKEIGEAESHG